MRRIRLQVHTHIVANGVLFAIAIGDALTFFTGVARFAKIATRTTVIEIDLRIDTSTIT
jgi:hypothetical protein